MKLIHLESDVELETSEFTNYLAVPLVLGKNAKVALKTLSAQFNEPPFIVDSSNDTFSFKTSDDLVPHVVTLTHDLYESIELLQNEIQNRMNNCLDGFTADDGTDINTDNAFQWQVEITPGTSSGSYDITFAFNRKDEEILSDANTSRTAMNYDTDNMFVKTGPAPSTPTLLNSYVVSDDLICKGGWNVTVVLDEQTPSQPEDIADSEWYLTIEPNVTLVGEQVTGNVFARSYAFIGVLGGEYIYKKDGSLINSGLAPEIGDEVNISNNNGVITYSLDTTSIVGDGIQALFPDMGSRDCHVVLYVGQDSGLIGFNDFGLTIDAFETSVGGQYIKTSNSALPQVRHDTNLGVPAASNVTLTLTNGSRRFFGFKDLTQSINAVSGTFAPLGNMTSSLFNNDLVVEVLELNTDCYDHSYKQKRNLLSVITSGEIKNSTAGSGAEFFELSLTEVFPNFIDIQNRQGTLTLSSLTVRISSQTFTLPLAGKMSCSLLFIDE